MVKWCNKGIIIHFKHFGIRTDEYINIVGTVLNHTNIVNEVKNPFQGIKKNHFTVEKFYLVLKLS